jgi:two-component system, response regulator PdtaR
MCNENLIMSKRILVVEDEEILRVGTTLHLKSFGYDVVGNFQRGEDAIANVIELKPDLILMDIKLSGEINGIETVKEIQKKIDVPVVYLSAYSNDELIEEAKSTKPFRYLIKPLDEMDLKYTIDGAIEAFKREQLYNIKDEVLANLNGMAYRHNIENGVKVTFFTDTFKKITGFNVDEIKSNGSHFLGSLIVNDDYESVINILNGSIESNKSFEMNYRIKNKNGDIKQFYEIGKPVFGQNNEIIHIDGIIFDLS